MKHSFIILGICLASFLHAQESSIDADVKAVLTEFIKATDEQDADRLSATMQAQAMQYVRFGPQILVFSKEQYLERIKAKTVGGQPRSVLFGEMMKSGEGVVTVKFEASSSQLKFLYQVCLMYLDNEWKITTINAEVGRV